MKFFSMLLVGASVFTISCERHEFDGPDGTKQLQMHHATSHGAEEHEAHPEHTGEATGAEH